MMSPDGRSLFRCSNRPGIGRVFVERFQREIYANDAVIRPGGRRLPVPRYFDRAVLSDDERYALGLVRAARGEAKRRVESSQVRREACELYERLMLERRIAGEPTALPRGKFG